MTKEPWPVFDAWWQAAAEDPDRGRVLLGGESHDGLLFCASGRFEGRDRDHFIFHSTVMPAGDRLAACFYWMALEKQIRLEGSCQQDKDILRLVPSRVEFWREGAYRLHERHAYQRDDEGGWQKEILYP